MTTDELLDNAANALSETDAGLARRLGLARQAIHQYRSGSRAMPDHHVTALAKLADLDPAATLASIRAERAPPETAAVWREIARRATLTSALLAVVGGIPHSTPAVAAKSLHDLYIMLSRRLRRPNADMAPQT